MSSPRKALVVIGALLPLPLALLLLQRVPPRASIRVTSAAAAPASGSAAADAAAPMVATDASVRTAVAAVATLPPDMANAPKRAVDAMAAGRYVEAADAYGRLAVATRDPVYAVAERVARRRAEAP